MGKLVSSVTDAVGLTDSGAAEKLANKSKALTKEQQARLANIKNLTEEDLAVVLQNPELIGQLEAQNIAPSELENITEDQSLRANQMKALEGLSQRADEGSTSEDKYAMEQMLGDVAGQEKASQADIEQDMARRGMDSSGASLLAQLQTKQSGANTARDKATQMAAQAQQNKMNALSQLGAQSGQMSAQDFNKQAQVKSAEDAIARANAMNRQNVSGANLAARQGIENQRANIANQQGMYNTGVKQQILNNEFTKAGAQNAASQNLANQYNQQAQSSAAADSAVTGGLMSLAGTALAGYMAPKPAAVESYFADGGISTENMPIQDQARQAEQKQRDAFKKKYMKQMHDEILASKEEVTREPRKSLKDFQNPMTAEDGLVFNKPQFNNGGISEKEEDDIVYRNGRWYTSKEAGEEYDKKTKDGFYQDQAKKRLKEREQIAERKINSERGYEDGGMYASDGMGDIIDSGEESYAGDRVDAKVNDGEMVINLPQQQRLMDLLRGEISVDELGSDDIIEGVPREDRDKMHEEGEEDSSESKEEQGLRKLLEMLGGL